MRRYKLSINDRRYEVEIKETSLHSIRATVNGKEKVVYINEIKNIKEKIEIPNRPSVSSNPVKQVASPPNTDSSDRFITAPMPGQIKAISVSEGDKVTAGQKLLTIEAMKMENDIKSMGSGTIRSIKVVVNDVVDQDQILIEIE
jgi:biotin carboxyl carrier protein